MSSTSPERILTASYPKSGATWFRFLVYGIEQGWTLESRRVRKFYPETGKEASWPDVDGSYSRVFAKTHFPYWSGNQAAHVADAVIQLVRNPFDCMMSRLSHYHMEGVNLSTRRKLSRFFEMFINSARMKQFEIGPNRADGGWIHHYLSWRELAATGKVSVVVRYEDLRSNCFATLSQINESLSFGWSPLAMQRGALFGSKQWMIALENYELENQIGGMFFSPKRAEAFAKNGLRFVGGPRRKEDFAIFMDMHRQSFLHMFSESCQELGYNLEEIIEDRWTAIA